MQSHKQLKQCIVYLFGIAAMPIASLPKSPNKSVDMANYAIFERKIGFPNQGSVAKYPQAFRGIIFASWLGIDFLDHGSILAWRF